ncbi:MAG: GGDEF domain-containing protein [Pseudohaliea sp.]
MLFRKQSKKESGAGAAQLEAKLETVAAREKLYRLLADDFLGWLGDFALDEADIDAAGFRGGLEKLRARLRELDRKDKAPAPVNRHAAFIPEFIARQQGHLQERDRELRDVIGILTRAVVDMNSRNEAYDSTVREQLDSMTELTRLEDIRRLRSGLLEELGQLRQTLEKKQQADASGMHGLKDQVDVLRVELEQAQEESRRDGLTGTFNRRAFDSFLGGLLDPGGARRRKFALMMLDLDNFKHINDRHGHPVGDRVLLALVGICRSVIRSEDFFARYGGDEFAIVFTGASARIAARKGREICEIVNGTVFTTEETDDEPAVNLAMSVSIGVTEHQAGDDYAGLMKRADDALYLAKGEGKNCVRTG